MENEEKIIKPSRHFVCLLFLYMVVIVQKAIWLYNDVSDYWNDSMYCPSIIHQRIMVISDMAMYLYAFIAIYKTLQRKPFSISMLKISSIYILLIHCIILFLNIKNEIPMNFIGMLLIFIFLIYFIIYLHSSKSPNEYIPQFSRMFGKTGWLGCVIYLPLISLSVFHAYSNARKESEINPPKISEAEMSKGMITDGLIGFLPMKDWESDSVINSQEPSLIYKYQSEQLRDIIISSTVIEDTTRLDYYQLLEKRWHSQIKGNMAMEEVENVNKHTKECIYYLNTYRVNNPDSASLFWTFSALINPKNYKTVIISNYEDSAYKESISMSEEFMKSIVF